MAKAPSKDDEETDKTKTESAKRESKEEYVFISRDLSKNRSKKSKSRAAKESIDPIEMLDKPDFEAVT